MIKNKKIVDVDNPKFDVICTWMGEKEDIMIVNKGFSYMLYDNPSNFERGTHGFSVNGDMLISKKQAKSLLTKLGSALNICSELDEGLNEYMEKNKPLWNYDGKLNKYIID